MRALILQQIIFAKRGKVPFIHQHGCNNYYKHLITSPTLARVAALSVSDLTNMNQTTFDAYLKGVDLPHAKAAALALPPGAAPAPVDVPPVVVDDPGDEPVHVVGEDPDEVDPIVGHVMHDMPPAPLV